MNQLRYHALVLATRERYRCVAGETCEERRQRRECLEFDQQIARLARIRRAGRCGG